MNLGQKVNYGMEVSLEKEKEVYPSIYIRTKEEIDFPDGRFTFSGEGKVVERVEKNKNGEECYCYEIDVYDMTPTGKVKDDDDEEGMESMEEAFSRAAKRMKKEKAVVIDIEEDEYED